MSNRTAFPDAIIFPDGTIRLVTSVAKHWAYNNTNTDRWCTATTVPDYIQFDEPVSRLMDNKGFVLIRERQPVFHYRSKRRTTAKSACVAEGEHDNHRARFEGLTLKEYRKQRRKTKEYSRSRAKNYRQTQKAPKRRKALQDDQFDSQ